MLQSVGINYKSSKYIAIIQNTLYTFKHNSFASNLINITDDNDDNNTHDNDNDSLSDQTSEDST